MKFELATIGVSYGGLQALEVIFLGLPPNLPIAIAIVQHRHKSSDGELTDFLQQYSLLPVMEILDKQPIRAGKVYLAPADYHLLVESGHFALSTEAPVTYARPSIDVLFETAADAYGKQVIGIILTGSSSDGARGLAKIIACGGVAIVQEPATAVSRIMPDAAIAAVPNAKILPLSEITSYLVNLCTSVEVGLKDKQSIRAKNDVNLYTSVEAGLEDKRSIRAKNDEQNPPQPTSDSDYKSL